ncbi:flagellar hook basal-body protein [Myxococcota bacterium]|nr:flagellar hook basal-body protein [Myxococcota bacterium]
MDDGLYVALAGGRAAWKALDVMANNLANVDTQGFKADRATFRVAMPDAAAGTDPRGDEGVMAERYDLVDEVTFDLTGGALRETGKPLDVALLGQGFLAVEGDQPGQELLTRDGGLSVDSEGLLVHGSGRRVVGEGGPIRLGGGPVEIDSRGRIVQSGEEIGRLKLVEVRGPRDLAKVGSNLWEADPASLSAAGDPRVEQGRVEGSNVDPARAMVDLVKVTRAYQAYQKVIETMSQLATQRDTQLGRWQ